MRNILNGSDSSKNDRIVLSYPYTGKGVVRMKRLSVVLLVLALVVFPLSGCAEEIPQPTAAGDFGLTMEQFEAYMEGSRIKIGVIYGFIPDPEGGKLEFREKEMDGIQKYTAIRPPPEPTSAPVPGGRRSSARSAHRSSSHHRGSHIKFPTPPCGKRSPPARGAPRESEVSHLQNSGHSRKIRYYNEKP